MTENEDHTHGSGEGLRKYIADAFLYSPRWALVIAFVYAIGFSAAAVYCAVMLFRCGGLGAKIAWAAFFLLFALFTMFTKMWFWELIHRNRILREIRRLEEKVDKLSQPPGPSQM